jgi:tetratricopeptide (TPR) repeat protein
MTKKAEHMPVRPEGIPTADSLPLSDWSNRIALIGRTQELDALVKSLDTWGRGYVYFWAQGGLGKTRLLEEFQRRVRTKGPGYRATDIIDLYHTDTHSNSDVERLIVEGLDADQKYFAGYRQQRAQYLRLRELGADPWMLEARRQKLTTTFVDEFNHMALEARKLVILFDTIELLQYESSLVEEKAGLDAVDTRLKPWMLNTLCQLHNVLVIFAGRPKSPSYGEQIDPHARFTQELRVAFGEDLSIVELGPLALSETQEFVQALPDGAQALPVNYIPIVHRLTRGRPIFLHLLVDLLRNPRFVMLPEALTLLEEWQPLVEIDESDPQLGEAREVFESKILAWIQNFTGEPTGYLEWMALLPKGVDEEILHTATGLPQDQARKLLSQIRDLSFVKVYKRAPALQMETYVGLTTTSTSPMMREERVFLHDEMYRLMTLRQDLRDKHRIELMQARSLIESFYDVQIKKAADQFATAEDTEKRSEWRSRLQSLHVERLYYLLVNDPRRGYAEYRRLSDQANRDRQVGFGMRLLDEFLRFYNTLERRAQFEAAGIDNNRVVRESAVLWVERFYRWAQYDRAIKLAAAIIADPGSLNIAQSDLPTLGNLCALWMFSVSLLGRDNPSTLLQTEEMLVRLREQGLQTPEARLAEARLATSIGYCHRLKGDLGAAIRSYVEANAAFRTLDCCGDERAMVLSNLAYCYALQGRMNQAHVLAREALRLNETLDIKYSTGLNLTTLAEIETMRGNYLEAIQYGTEAIDVFDELQDAHGTVLALKSISQARRKKAKYEIQKQRKLVQARQELQEAEAHLAKAIQVARDNGLANDEAMLHAKQGKVCRELGFVVSRLEMPDSALSYYMRSQDEFLKALNMPQLGSIEKASMLVDFAEMLFVSGNPTAAEDRLKEFEREFGIAVRQTEATPTRDEWRPQLEFYRAFGKAERLRGRMALENTAQTDSALQHFARAYDYFVRFSSYAPEKDTMIELLYDQLRDLPMEQQRRLVSGLRTWVSESKDDSELKKFVGFLEELLGL